MKEKNNSDACASSLEDISNSMFETIKLHKFPTSCFFVRDFLWFWGGVGCCFGFFFFLHISPSLAIESEKHMRTSFSF